MNKQRSWPVWVGQDFNGVPPDESRNVWGSKTVYYNQQADLVLRDIPEDATPYPEHMPVGTVVRNRNGGFSYRVMLPWTWDPYVRNYITMAGGDTGMIPITSVWFSPVPQTETIAVSGPPEAVAKIRAKAEAKGLEVGNG